MNVGVVGARSLSFKQQCIASYIGFALVALDHDITTGGAPGADQAYARGAYLWDAERVHLYLPTKGFETQHHHQDAKISIYPNIPGFDATESLATQGARALHPPRYFERFSQFAHQAYGRNALIAQNTDQLVAWRGSTTSGTQHTIACARILGKAVWDITTDAVRAKLIQHLEMRLYEKHGWDPWPKEPNQLMNLYWDESAMYERDHEISLDELEAGRIATGMEGPWDYKAGV